MVSPLLRGDESTAGHSAGLQAKGRCLCASSPILPPLRSVSAPVHPEAGRSPSRADLSISGIFSKQQLLFLLLLLLQRQSKVGACSALPQGKRLASAITHETQPISDAQLTPEQQLLVLILKPEAVMCLNSREMTEWKRSHLITSHIQITMDGNLAITSTVIVKAVQSNSLLRLPSIMGSRDLSAESVLRGKNESLYLF